MREQTCSACGAKTDKHHWYPPDKDGFRLCPECNPGELRAALAEREQESTDLLDAIFQTVDLEDGEEIVAEAFPKGCPAWVLAWYQEHPTDEDLAREGGEESVCYLCGNPVDTTDPTSEHWPEAGGWRHFDCPEPGQRESQPQSG